MRPAGKGVSRVLANLAPRLLARGDRQVRYIVLTTATGADLMGTQPPGSIIVVPEMLDSLWVHWGLPLHALRAGADLIYLFREGGPLWGPPYILHVPEDPTVRWTRIPPDAWRVRARAALDRMTMSQSVRRARLLATATTATASDLARRFAIRRSRFAVVPLGVDRIFFQGVDDHSRVE